MSGEIDHREGKMPRESIALPAGKHHGQAGCQRGAQPVPRSCAGGGGRGCAHCLLNSFRRLQYAAAGRARYSEGCRLVPGPRSPRPAKGARCRAQETLSYSRPGCDHGAVLLLRACSHLHLAEQDKLNRCCNKTPTPFITRGRAALCLAR